MSGIPDAENADIEAANRVWRALNRELPIASLLELHNGMRSDRRPNVQAGQVLAFGFDTNAIFRLGLGKQGVDALDYLQTVHSGPIVIPGQGVQELWNNQVAALQPKAKTLRKQFEALIGEASGIGIELGDAGVAVKDAISALESEHGEWVDPQTQEALDNTLAVLLKAGRVSYVPRTKFETIAKIRKDTKTPPGFKDPVGFGDFFIWADFLFGIAKVDPDEYDGVVFVTNDEKQDWSRDQIAHPVLVAEVVGLTGKPFWLWNLDAFRQHVRLAMKG